MIYTYTSVPESHFQLQSSVIHNLTRQPDCSDLRRAIMACMSTRTAEFLDAIEQLPNGAALVIQQFTWDDYEGLLEDLQHRPGLRVSYDSGWLEVVSPLPEHEKYARLIDLMVHSYCEELDLEVESYGGATWKSRVLGKGAEPDACYYVKNAARVIGKRKFDLEFDPPPDIVVEIDITNESLSKFPIYAALSVPEIWRYDSRQFQFYALIDGEYVKVAARRFLPGLTGPMMAETIEASLTQGQTRALKAFRKRVRSANLLRK